MSQAKLLALISHLKTNLPDILEDKGSLLRKNVRNMKVKQELKTVLDERKIETGQLNKVKHAGLDVSPHPPTTKVPKIIFDRQMTKLENGLHISFLKRNFTNFQKTLICSDFKRPLKKIHYHFNQNR